MSDINEIHRPIFAIIDILAASTVASYLFGFLHQLPVFFAALASGLSASWYAYCLWDAYHAKKRKKHH